VFRGRPLVVNFARTKKDAEQALDGEDRQDDASETGDHGEPDYESGPDFDDNAFPAEDPSDEDEDGDTKGV
jgi:hypothetical protein